MMIGMGLAGVAQARSGPVSPCRIDGFGAQPPQANGPTANGDTSAPAGGDGANAKSPCYRIAAAVVFKSGRRTASEVVIALGDAFEPYRVLSWQNDVEFGTSTPPRGRL